MRKIDYLIIRICLVVLPNDISKSYYYMKLEDWKIIPYRNSKFDYEVYKRQIEISKLDTIISIKTKEFTKPTYKSTPNNNIS